MWDFYSQPCIMEFNLGFYSIVDSEDTGYKLYSTGGISKTAVSNLCLEPHFPTNHLMGTKLWFFIPSVSVHTHAVTTCRF